MREQINNLHIHKAKDKDDGRWYEGYYLLLHDTTYFCMPSDNEANIKRLNEENAHHYIVFEQMTDWGLPNRHLRVEILPETLCRCTGLPDKNRKLIWENDIVRCGEDVFAVKWNDKYARWCLSKKGWLYNDFFGEACDPKDCEVIGNIFDNQELLNI